MSRSRIRVASQMLAAARDSLHEEAFEGALALARGVIRDYPGSPGSGEALYIAARALDRLGAPGESAASAMRLIPLLGEEHPTLPDLCILAGRGYWQEGDHQRALDALRALPPTTPESVLGTGRGLLREILPDLSDAALQSSLEAFPSTNPLRGILAAQWASALYLQGRRGEAEVWARTALQEDLEEPEREIALGVIEGRLEGVLAIPLTVGAVLPRSGASPGLLQYGEWIQEGVQVALEEYKDRLTRPVDLRVIDDSGNPLAGGVAVLGLQDSGAFASVGCLTQQMLEEAAAARRGPFPLVSPFAYLPPEVAPAVYSLSGPDPGGARQLARVARDLDLGTVAVVRPRTEEARVEAAAFQDEFQALGGVVPREIVFDSGGTFFQPQFQEVETILPDGLFLPLTPRDVQLLAPQVTFYGLDTLGIQLLGTSGWTEESVVQGVDSRHTDGVVAATVRLSQDETEAFRRFREGYESLFQKTLRSQVPAFGYDCAALLFAALEARPRNPEELVSAIEGVRDLPGATGNLTVDRGWVTREPLLVRIQDHELIYITRRYR